MIGLQAETRNQAPNVDTDKTTTARYQEIEKEPDDENLSSNSRTDTHKLSLCDVISVDKDKVVDMNIPQTRENKQRCKNDLNYFSTNCTKKLTIERTIPLKKSQLSTGKFHSSTTQHSDNNSKS